MMTPRGPRVASCAAMTSLASEPEPVVEAEYAEDVRAAEEHR